MPHNITLRGFEPHSLFDAVLNAVCSNTLHHVDDDNYAMFDQFKINSFATDHFMKTSIWIELRLIRN